MLEYFNTFHSKRAAYPMKKRQTNFLNDVRGKGVQNPYRPSETVITDDLGLEFEVKDNIVFITNIRAYDNRLWKATKILKDIIATSHKHDVIIGLNPFPIKEAGLKEEEVIYWFSNLGFIRNMGKWIREPNYAPSI